MYKWQAVIFNGNEQSIIMGCSYHQILGLLRVLNYDRSSIIYPDGSLEDYNSKDEFLELVDELEEVEENNVSD